MMPNAKSPSGFIYSMLHRNMVYLRHNCHTWSGILEQLTGEFVLKFADLNGLHTVEAKSSVRLPVRTMRSVMRMAGASGATG